MKEKVEMEYGLLKIGNRYFEPGTAGQGRPAYTEIDSKKVKERLTLLKEIATKLKDSLDKEAVLMEALSKLENEYLQQLHNALYNSKRETKPKTRRHHCVDIKVGRMIVPIV